MSAFGDILRRIVERVPGAIGAVFSDWEGEPVDQFAHIPELEIQIVGAHWGLILGLATSRLGRHGLGRVDELLIEMDEATVLVRTVTEQYFVVLAVARGGHLGTARRELDRGTQTLRGEM